MKRVVIIGNGIAGSSCARFVRKYDADAHITMVSNETPYFYSRTALMYVYMGHMRFKDLYPYASSFWTKNRIQLRQAQVQAIDVQAHYVRLDKGDSLPYDVLVLATGSQSRRGGWPGETHTGVGYLYSYQDLKALESHSAHVQQAVIVGGGLIGVELAEMLHSRGKSVVFLVRDKRFWPQALPLPESDLIVRHIRAHGIDLRLSAEVAELLGDKNKRLCGLRTTANDRIACEWAGIAIGVVPNITCAQSAGIETQKGVLVDEYLQTSAADVYAIGDCAELRAPTADRQAIEPIWYVARQMGETLACTLTQTPTRYQPELWFNSAKFFDIEYQIYGHVPLKKEAHTTSLYWAHPHKSQCMRIAWDTQSRAVLGCHVLGWRQKRAVWHRWIVQQTPIEVVLAQLEEARFDAEFAFAPEKQIRQAFQNQSLTMTSNEP